MLQRVVAQARQVSFNGVNATATAPAAFVTSSSLLMMTAAAFSEMKKRLVMYASSIGCIENAKQMKSA